MVDILEILNSACTVTKKVYDVAGSIKDAPAAINSLKVKACEVNSLLKALREELKSTHLFMTMSRILETYSLETSSWTDTNNYRIVQKSSSRC